MTPANDALGLVRAVKPCASRTALRLRGLKAGCALHVQCKSLRCSGQDSTRHCPMGHILTFTGMGAPSTTHLALRGFCGHGPVMTPETRFPRCTPVSDHFICVVGEG